MPLGGMWMTAPIMGLVDGPTEVHRITVARQVLKGYQPVDGSVAHRAPARAQLRRGPGEVRRVPRARSGELSERSTPSPDDRRRRSGLVIDERLAGWMDDRTCPGRGSRSRPSFITGGASNELFDDHAGAATAGPAPAARASSRQGRNETMLREYRLLAALADTDVPHARVRGRLRRPRRCWAAAST